MVLKLNNFYPFHRIWINKYHVRPVLNEIIELSHGKVLDIGCGEKPYYKFVKHKVEKYVGLDHPETPHPKENIDVFATAYSIPFESNYFDVAILTQVIEHLEDPQKALNEINRVLKKRGVLILAWPFLYPIHEAPRDFFRYTSYGMQSMAEMAGYEVQKIVPASGFWITLFGFISLYLFGKSKYIYFCFSPLILLIFFLCSLLNKIDRNKNSYFKWTWNYYAVLIKKGVDDKEK